MRIRPKVLVAAPGVKLVLGPAMLALSCSSPYFLWLSFFVSLIPLSLLVLWLALSMGSLSTSLFLKPHSSTFFAAILLRFTSQRPRSPTAQIARSPKCSSVMATKWLHTSQVCAAYGHVCPTCRSREMVAYSLL